MRYFALLHVFLSPLVPGCSILLSHSLNNSYFCYCALLSHYLNNSYFCYCALLSSASCLSAPLVPGCIASYLVSHCILLFNSLNNSYLPSGSPYSGFLASNCCVYPLLFLGHCTFCLFNVVYLPKIVLLSYICFLSRPTIAFLLQFPM